MNYISIEEVIKIHDNQILYYGGEKGILNHDILDSCLMNPMNSFGNIEYYPGDIRKAARLCYNICMNHPFVDGNKRTSVQILETVLYDNSYELKLSKSEIISIILSLVTHQIDFDEFYSIIKKNTFFINEDEEF